MTDFRDILEKVRKGESLAQPDMISAMTCLMDGHASDAQIGAFLMGLSQRGETADELTGAVRVLRARARALQAPEGTVDCCGTGGDHAATWNISSAVALVVAGCGVPVAKHGNRAASSQSGTADVYEALGMRLDVSVPRLEEALRLFHFCFLMAPRHHEAMRHVAPARKQLGFRTFFNLVGPLCNPAGAAYQVIGVFDPARARVMAETLSALGTRRAWIVHGSDGLDEVTTTGQSSVLCMEQGNSGLVLSEKTLVPEDFGVARADPDSLRGGDPARNANALKAVLEGARNAYRDIVVVNAACVLMVCGTENNPLSAAQRAAQALDDGSALRVLNAYTDFSHAEEPAP